MKRVLVPGMGTVSVPDDVTDEQFASALESYRKRPSLGQVLEKPIVQPQTLEQWRSSMATPKPSPDIQTIPEMAEVPPTLGEQLQTPLPEIPEVFEDWRTRMAAPPATGRVQPLPPTPTPATGFMLEPYNLPWPSPAQPPPAEPTGPQIREAPPPEEGFVETATFTPPFLPEAPPVEKVPPTDLEKRWAQTIPVARLLKEFFGEDMAVQVGRQGWNVAKSVPEFALGSVAGRAGLAVGGRFPATTSAAFALDTARSLFEQIPTLIKGWDTMSNPERARAITQALGTAGILGMLIHGGAAGHHLRARLQAERARAIQRPPQQPGLDLLRANIADALGIPLGVARPEAARPPVLPVIPATPQTEREVTDARKAPEISGVSPSAAVYGAVRPQPVEGLRQVPAEVGRPGVGPQPGAQAARLGEEAQVLLDKVRPAVALIPERPGVPGELIEGNKGEPHDDMIIRLGIDPMMIDRRTFVIAGTKTELTREQLATIPGITTQVEPRRAHSSDLTRAQQAAAPVAEPAIVSQIEAMTLQGATAIDIAKQLGMSAEEILHIRNERGIPSVGDPQFAEWQRTWQPPPPPPRTAGELLNVTPSTAWEKGGARPLRFDPSSTAAVGRFRLSDPNLYEKGQYITRQSSTEGISYIMGRRKDTGKMEVQSVNFARAKWSEGQAEGWLRNNLARLGRPDMVTRGRAAMRREAPGAAMPKALEEAVIKAGEVGIEPPSEEVIAMGYEPNLFTALDTLAQKDPKLWPLTPEQRAELEAWWATQEGTRLSKSYLLESNAIGAETLARDLGGVEAKELLDHANKIRDRLFELTGSREPGEVQARKAAAVLPPDFEQFVRNYAEMMAQGRVMFVDEISELPGSVATTFGDGILISRKELALWWGRDMRALNTQQKIAALGSLMDEENIHLIVDQSFTEEGAAKFWHDYTPVEKAAFHKIYTGYFTAANLLRKRGREFTPAQLGHEAIRMNVQWLRQVPLSEVAAAAGTDRLSVNTLFALNRALFAARRALGTEASGRQAAILRDLHNKVIVGLATVGAPGLTQPSRFRRGAPEEAREEPEYGVRDFFENYSDLYRLMLFYDRNGRASEAKPVYDALVWMTQKYPQWSKEANAMVTAGEVGAPRIGPGLGPSAFRRRADRMKWRPAVTLEDYNKAKAEFDADFQKINQHQNELFDTLWQNPDIAPADRAWWFDYGLGKGQPFGEYVKVPANRTFFIRRTQDAFGVSKETAQAWLSKYRQLYDKFQASSERLWNYRGAMGTPSLAGAEGEPAVGPGVGPAAFRRRGTKKLLPGQLFFDLPKSEAVKPPPKAEVQKELFPAVPREERVTAEQAGAFVPTALDLEVSADRFLGIMDQVPLDQVRPESIPEFKPSIEPGAEPPDLATFTQRVQAEQPGLTPPQILQLYKAELQPYRMGRYAKMLTKPPNFNTFVEWLRANYGDLEKGQVVELWKAAVWRKVTEAPGEVLAKFRKALRLERRLGTKPIEDAPRPVAVQPEFREAAGVPSFSMPKRGLLGPMYGVSEIRRPILPPKPRPERPTGVQLELPGAPPRIEVPRELEPPKEPTAPRPAYRTIKQFPVRPMRGLGPMVRGLAAELNSPGQIYRRKVAAAIAQKLIAQAEGRPRYQKTAVTAQDIGWGRASTVGVYHTITPGELGNIKVRDHVLTEGGLVGPRIPKSITRRVVALLHKDSKAVELVSAYLDPKKGAMLVKPEIAFAKRPHVPVDELLKTYQPILSILLRDPVQNFRQRFPNLQSFMDKLGKPAAHIALRTNEPFWPAAERPWKPRRAGEEAEVEARPPYVAQPGIFMTGQQALEKMRTTPLTQAEAGAVIRRVHEMVPGVPTAKDMERVITDLATRGMTDPPSLSATDRAIISGLWKAAHELQRRSRQPIDTPGGVRLARMSNEDAYRAALNDFYEIIQAHQDQPTFRASTAEAVGHFARPVSEAVAARERARAAADELRRPKPAPTLGVTRELTMREPPAVSRFGPKITGAIPAPLTTAWPGPPTTAPPPPTPRRVGQIRRQAEKGKAPVVRETAPGEPRPEEMLDAEAQQWVESLAEREHRYAPTPRRPKVFKTPEGIEVPKPGLARFRRTEAKERSQELFSITKKRIVSTVTRRGVKQDIYRTLDGAENAAAQYTLQAGNAIRLQSNNPMVRAAARAVIAAGEKTEQGWSPNPNKLPQFLIDIDEGARQAAQWMKSNNPITRRIGRKWFQAAQRLRREVEYAQQHWNDDELQNTVLAARKELREEYEWEVDNGSNLKEVENYAPGLYEAEIFNDSAVTWGEMRVLGRNFRLPKTFLDHYAAIKVGPYIPASYDIADIAQNRIARGRYVVMKRLWMDTVKAMRDPATGLNVAIPAVPVEKVREVIDPDTGKVTKAKVTDHWMVPPGKPNRQLVWPMKGGQPLAVLDGYQMTVRVASLESQIPTFLLGREALLLSSMLKHGVVLILDSFHPGRLFQYAASLGGRNWRTTDMGYRGGFSALNYRAEDLPLAVEQGLIPRKAAEWALGNVPVKVLRRGPTKTGWATELQTVNMTRQDLASEMVTQGLNSTRIADALYKDAVARVPGIGGTWHKLIAPMNRWIFDRLTTGLIMETAVRNFERLNAAHPDVPVARLMKDVITDTNAYYGNMRRQGIFKHPTFRDVAQILLLAPLWREGLWQKEVRFVSRLTAGPISKALGLPYRRGLPMMGTLGRGIARGLLAYFILGQVINLISRGKFTFQNEEEGHKMDAWVPLPEGGGFWIPTMGVFMEVFHDVLRLAEKKSKTWDVLTQMGANMLGPVGRFWYVLATGRQVYPLGAPISTTGGVLKRAVGEIVPSPVGLATPISLGTPTRAIASLIAPKQVRPPRPGELPQRLLGSVGVRAFPSETAVQQIGRKAQDFIQKNKLERNIGFEWRETDEPSFAKLRQALRYKDERGARSIVKELRKRLGPEADQHIWHSMELWSTRPFTGSKNMDDYAFFPSLTPPEQELYVKAMAEKAKEFQDFVSWWFKLGAEQGGAK